MRWSKVISAALDITGEGRAAYICYDGGVLDAHEKPVGDIILKIRPGETSTRKSLSILLNHRMRIKGIISPGRRRTVKPARGAAGNE